MIKTIFNTLLFNPLYNALIAIYLLIPDLGVAIIILTVIIRLLLLPIARKSIESQKKMQELQPEIKKIRDKYKDNKQLQGQKMMELYKEKKINPAAGCLPLIVQLVFLIALYQVFMRGIGQPADGAILYSFLENPGVLEPISFGFLDLSKPNIPLAVIAAGLQFVQAKMLMSSQPKKEKNQKENKKDEEPDFASIMQQQMLYMGPVITLVIGFQFPSGLIVYWITTTIFMIVQQYFVFKEKKETNPKLAN